jgi:hypothetical protein
MDLDDMEDMLCGPDASPEDFDDASNASSDEILDEADVDELTLWDEADSPLPTPFNTDQEVEEAMLPTARPQHKSKGQLAPDAMRTTRDRW